MPSTDTYYKIDESSPKNTYLLKYIKSSGKSLRQVAKDMNINISSLSQALNKKKVTKPIKLKIAKFFGVDTIEVFG